MTLQVTEAPHNSCGLLGWLTFERRNWMALILVAGAGGFSLGNGHTTQGAVQNISDQLGQKDAQVQHLKAKVIPALKAEAGCEHWRADTAAKLALQTSLIDPKELPGDCPHPAVVK